MRKTLLLLAMTLCGMTSAQADDTKLEAEDATYSTSTVVEDTKYSGGKAIKQTDSEAKLTFTYNATAAGKYTIYVCCEGIGGQKTINLSVNGASSTFQTTVDTFTEIDTGTHIFNEGANTIEITPNWTWYNIDYIRIATPSSSIEFNISADLVDANASVAAKKVYTFLYDNFGKKTISGIMTGDMTTAAAGDVTQHEDVQAVYAASGKYPALVGFDFMNATGKSADTNDWYKQYTDAAVALAYDLFARGGIPAFTWHWRDPSRETDAFYCNGQDETTCTMKISDAMNADGSWNTSSDIYKYMIKDIDHIADYFLAMQNVGIAAIFRPLHECSGGWFWWGADGAENFVKLYQLVYDEMVNVKGVHNLIWVWNPAKAEDSDWNPGEAYYDVAGIDIYNEAYDYSSNYAAFEAMKKLTAGKKIITLSENGPIPDVDKEFTEEAVWSWWMPWYESWSGGFVSKTSKEQWTKCMTDSRIVTLEDLSAGWGTYTAIPSIKPADAAPSATIYTLNGIPLSKFPTKGIFIQSGKKHLLR